VHDKFVRRLLLCFERVQKLPPSSAVYVACLTGENHKIFEKLAHDLVFFSVALYEGFDLTMSVC